MSTLILGVLLLQQPNLLPQPPAAESLKQARTWSVWQKQEKEMFEKALSAMARRDFNQADKWNRQLLALAPKSIYDDPPTLPTILIRPAGSKSSPQEDRPLSGWKWRRESAWLSVWAGSHQEAFDEFKVIMASSQAESILAVEGALYALSRLRRWQDCRSLSKQTSVGGPKLARIYALALGNQWEQLRLAALRVSDPRLAPPPESRPSPTLSGSIGGSRGQGRSLPPTATRQPSGPAPGVDGVSWASVEAALILLDSKMSAWQAEKKSSAKKAQAVFWVNILLRDAREAFPNHRQAAYSALVRLKQ